jgi:ribosomal protein L11 methyltransferase
MFWKVSFHCDATQVGDFGNLLEDHVTAVSWFETKDPNLWMVEAILSLEPNPQDFITLLSPVCENFNIPVPCVTVGKIPETDWLEATWRSFPPQQIGRYYVYGSHTLPTPPQDSVILEINAATAFGSGEHETTTGCLLTLNDLADEGRKFDKPLDMGCGSGILAIAMAKTWTIQVISADNDPESVRMTMHNAILNGCAPLIASYVSESFNNQKIHANGPYDLIVANILATPLIEMAKDLSQSLAYKGTAILSGLLSRHRGEIVKAYQQYNMRLVSHRTLNDWEVLLLEKG